MELIGRGCAYSVGEMEVSVAQLCPALCQPMDCTPTHRLLCPWDSSGKNTGVDSHSFLQGSSSPRDWTWVSCIADRFFTIWATSPYSGGIQGFIEILFANKNGIYHWELGDVSQDNYLEQRLPERESSSGAGIVHWNKSWDSRCLQVHLGWKS